jgi:NADH dehydrogenase
MSNLNKKKQIVVIGGGFAGIHLIRNLDENLFDIVLIDKLNHHQFQPLFYQVATSQIEPSSISFPLRNVFKHKKNLQIRMAEVTEIDRKNKLVLTSIGIFNYDYLVIATGCRTNFFGNQNLEENVLTLKTTYEAIKIRNHILQTFEKVLSANRMEKDKLLNLVIVGAGPTGVELAGAFAEVKKYVLPKDYPGIDFTKLNIYLVEGSNSSLKNMSEVAQKASMQYLAELGVRILTEVHVKDYNGERVFLSNGSEIETKTVIWVAGVTGNSVKGLPQEAVGPGNRIEVNRIGQVLGDESVFAVGDIALMRTPKYQNGHPQVANVAINQAKLLAKNLKAIETGKKITEFEYRDLGSMATIGTRKAVVDLPFMKFKGYPAWFIWMFLHLMLILSVRNKLIIFINWAWKFITKDTSLRLILVQPK